MVKSKKKKSSTKSINRNAAVPGGGEGLEWMNVDPSRIRFQHARVRPYFSGCGRSVQGTLESIRDGNMKPTDLPPIQVLIGPNDDNGNPWYFSLNNRRLWVLKRCREEGLLENNLIHVRVRQPKSNKESQRYTIDNCTLEAKFIRERQVEDNNTKDDDDDSNDERRTKSRLDASIGINNDDDIEENEKKARLKIASIDLNEQERVNKQDTDITTKNDNYDDVGEKEEVSDGSEDSEESYESTSPNKHAFNRNTFCFDDDTSSSDSE